MDIYRVTGGKSLFGAIRIQGSKNTALPVIAATVLHRGVTVLNHCPSITDVHTALAMITAMGGQIEWKDRNQVVIDTRALVWKPLADSYYEKMRSSVLFLGPFLNRFQSAEIYAPGGCMIGLRPIDLHLYGLERLGAKIVCTGSKIQCRADRLRGNKISFPVPSVGATENVILASVLADGETEIENAAVEPEITSLCAFLNAAGARISWKKDGHFYIRGVRELKDTVYDVPGDRIVAGTYLAAVAGTGGCVAINGISPEELQAPIRLCRTLRCKISCETDRIRITKQPQNTGGYVCISTAPYPGFPTDLQSVFTAVLAGTGWDADVDETIFENRFRIVPELKRMGAVIETLSPNRIRIHGGGKLHGAQVTSRELRGGAALLTAALLAEGTTRIEDNGYIARGYEDIAGDLRSLGAEISRIT